MEAYILYAKPTHVTGKRLASALDLPSGRDLPPDWKSLDVLFRWGNTNYQDIDSYLQDQGAEVLNTATSIRSVSNRQHMISRMSNPSFTPLSYSHHIGPIDCSDNRTLLRHRFGRWGQDCILVDNNEPANTWYRMEQDPGLDGYFSVEYWPADYEVRVHIFNGTSILFQIKKPEDDSVDTETDPVIRNTRRGWQLLPLSAEEARQLGINKDSIRDAAKHLISRANHRIGLDFGTADFLVRTYQNRPSNMAARPLEINSAPGLEGYSLERYVEHISEFLSNHSRTETEPHFDRSYRLDCGQTLDDVINDVLEQTGLAHSNTTSE